MRKPKMPEEVMIAYHEAGHAVMMLLGGARVIRVAVGLDEIDIPGQTRVDTRYRASPMQVIAEKYAGHAAVVIARGLLGRYPRFGEVAESGASDDWCKADAVIAKLTSDPRKQQGWRRSGWQTAVSVLRDQWYSTERVANALQDRQVLSGRELLELVDDSVLGFVEFHRRRRSGRGRR